MRDTLTTEAAPTREGASDGQPSVGFAPHRRGGRERFHLVAAAESQADGAGSGTPSDAQANTAELGLRKEDPTIAELLKPLGYVSGQFGKNHLGDKDEFLPTAHGFDEFFGNLYHLNAEEEPENADYPKNPEFRQHFGPRGVIKSTADGKSQDTGPLTRKRMETVDEEFLAAALDFIDRAQKANKPFFV